MSMDPRPSPFGVLLRRQRQAAALTQEELAERAHLSWRTISDLERGRKHTPRPDTLALLADALALLPAERAAFEAAACRPAPATGSGRAGTAEPTTSAPVDTATPLGRLLQCGTTYRCSRPALWAASGRSPRSPRHWTVPGC